MENEKKTDEVKEAEETLCATEETTAKDEPEKEGKKKSEKKTKAELTKLKEELEAACAALEEEKKNHLYLAAEYDNFRRRSQKERTAFTRMPSATPSRRSCLFSITLRAQDSITRRIRSPRDLP